MTPGNGNGRLPQDARFRGLVATLGALWEAKFRGKVLLDMDGSGGVRLKAEPPSVDIKDERVARIAFLTD